MKEVKIYYSDNGQMFYDMEEATTNDKISELKKEVARIYGEIQKLQDNCSHHHMTVSAHADTGNYCRSDDSYWYEGACRACGERFSFEQSEDSILKERHRALGRDPRVEKGK